MVREMTSELEAQYDAVGIESYGDKKVLLLHGILPDDVRQNQAFGVEQALDDFRDHYRSRGIEHEKTMDVLLARRVFPSEIEMNQAGSTIEGYLVPDEEQLIAQARSLLRRP